jgi:hypothetical protein
MQSANSLVLAEAQIEDRLQGHQALAPPGQDSSSPPCSEHTRIVNEISKQYNYNTQASTGTQANIIYMHP